MSVKIKYNWTSILLSVLVALVVVYISVLVKSNAKKAAHTEFINSVSVIEKILSGKGDIDSLRAKVGDGDVSKVLFEGVLALNNVEDLTFDIALNSIGKIGVGGIDPDVGRNELDDLEIGGRGEIVNSVEESGSYGSNGTTGVGESEPIYFASSRITGGGIFAYNDGIASHIQVSDVLSLMSLDDLIKGGFALKFISCTGDYMEAVFLSERYCSKMVLVVDSGEFRVLFGGWR